MGTYVAPGPAIRTLRILVGLIAVAFVAALALGVALATRAISFDSRTTNSSQDALVPIHTGYGTGYPSHYGLAGPSDVVRVDSPLHGGPASLNGLGSSAQEGYGTDYPPHHGLAGPSDVVRGDSPLHGGLASPNGFGSSAQEGYGTDYPPHHGLAGPSAVESSQ